MMMIMMATTFLDHLLVSWFLDENWKVVFSLLFFRL